MTRRNIVGMLLSRFDYNRVTVTIVHISVRERLRRLEACTTRDSYPLGYAKTAVILARRHDCERLPGN